jgi:hypothetical protein
MVRIKTPGAEMRPGAIREFEFPKYNDSYLMAREICNAWFETRGHSPSKTGVNALLKKARAPHHEVVANPQ